MAKIHRTCYWNYVYGYEYEACNSCRQRLLDADEPFCSGAYTRDWKPVALPPWPYNCRCRCCHCSCHCPEFWAELFGRLRGDDERILRLLPEHTTAEEFGCLYHEGYVHAYRITQNDTDAHDAVQTAFFKIHRHPESPQDLRAMFHRAVHNAAIDIVRRRKRYVPIDDQRCPEQETPRDPIVAAEEAMSLEEAMDGLTADDQQILRMHYVEGLSHKQIAERLEVTVTTVNNRLATARRRLKEKLLESAAFPAV